MVFTRITARPRGVINNEPLAVPIDASDRIGAERAQIGANRSFTGPPLVETTVATFMGLTSKS